MRRNRELGKIQRIDSSNSSDRSTKPMAVEEMGQSILVRVSVIWIVMEIKLSVYLVFGVENCRVSDGKEKIDRPRDQCSL
jgi:hypothetical protein